MNHQFPLNRPSFLYKSLPFIKGDNSNCRANVACILKVSAEMARARRALGRGTLTHFPRGLRRRFEWAARGSERSACRGRSRVVLRRLVRARAAARRSSPSFDARDESGQRQQDREERRAVPVRRAHLPAARGHHRDHRRARLLQQLRGRRALLPLQAAADAHQPAAGQHQPERPAGVAQRGKLHFRGVRQRSLDLEPGDVRLGRFQQQLIR